MRARAARGALAALAFVLPFEPLRTVFSAFGLGFTLLELAAAAAAALVLVSRRSRVFGLVTRPAWPLAFLAAFAFAHLLSAAFAADHARLSAIFALRMVAAAAVALAVAAAPVRARWAALSALAGASVLVALLAIGEGLGAAWLDPLLSLFRERAFAMGSTPRASGASGGPNQAAAFLAAGLVAGAARLAGRPAVAAAFACLASLGLLFTYSRGGLAAALAGLLVLAWAGRPARRTALASAAALALLAASFVAHPRFRERWGTELAERSYHARYDAADAVLRLAPGESRLLAVELVNLGPRDWPPADRPTLHAFLYEVPPREPVAIWRHVLARPVGAGHVERVSLTIEAPPRAGPYVLVWDLFTLPAGFLSASGVAPVLVPVGVGAEPPAAPNLPERAWRRGRVELWRLALAMWRERPVLGVGPDNFRRLHPRYGGWLGAGNVPMSAHNQLLETAATTGLLGLIALMGTVAFTARASLAARHRADAPLAAVVLALLAAFLVQAQVDALLEFTGHYLLFAFLVGAAAAMEAKS